MHNIFLPYTKTYLVGGAL
uniref:Uncharacterized protein n=1 Tax=Anguilla anguilla TaxID=7936 RepID=A0A0E9RZP4_ANGAN